MYSDTLGSLGIMGWIFTEESIENPKPTVQEMKSKWRRLLRGEVPVTFDDPDFIKKGLEYFGMKVPNNFPIAFVQSDWNAVFAPFVDGTLLPNREDGFAITTLRKGKVYPIELTEKNKDELEPDTN